MLSRRDLVGKLAAGAAAVCAVGVAQTGLASTRREANTPSGTGDVVDGSGVRAESGAAAQIIDSGPPAQADVGTPSTLDAPPRWDLVRPLEMNSEVVPGWRVAGLTGIVYGSCVLTLKNEQGRSYRVHLCRNDGRPQGLVYTKRFDLVVMNGGQGDLPTDEGLARAVAEVAHVLAANERVGMDEPVVTALLPHAERVQRFGSDATLR